MSISDRKKREKEKLKKKILTMTAEIVALSGHNSLTIRDLAEKIEYSPRTVYLYFPDKAALLEAVIERGFEVTAKQIEKLNSQYPIPPEKMLKIMIRNHIEMAFFSPNYYRAVVSLAMDKDFQPGFYQRKVIDGVRQLLSLYFTDSQREEDEIELLTGILMNSLNGFTLRLVNSNEYMDQTEIDKDLRIFTKFVFEGLRGY